VIGVLGKIGKNYSSTVSILVELIEKSPDELTKRLVASSLGEIDNSSLIAIQTLEDLSQKSQSELTKRLAANSLGQIDNRNIIALQTLEYLSQKSENQENRFLAVLDLIEIYPENYIAIQTLEDLSQDFNNNELNRLIAADKIIEINKDNLIASSVLKDLIQNSQDEEIRERADWILGKIPKGEPATIAALVKLIHDSQDSSNCLRAADSLKAILTQSQMRGVIRALKVYLSEQTYKNDFLRFYGGYQIIWHCAQDMTYPAFSQAWHQQEEVEKTTTPDRQTLNRTDLPQSLQSAIANDPQLSQIIHLICIDRSQFIDPDRPTAEIYDQMLDQNCPECEPVPETMPALKLYWKSLKRKSDKRVVLVFYASSTDTTSAKGTTLSCPYSEAFLTVLSKFGREICVITEQRFEHIPLKFFAPSQAIEDVVKWIRVHVMEE
jgi:hypothetical protein